MKWSVRSLRLSARSDFSQKVFSLSLSLAFSLVLVILYRYSLFNKMLISVGITTDTFEQLIRTGNVVIKSVLVCVYGTGVIRMYIYMQDSMYNVLLAS